MTGITFIPLCMWNASHHPMGQLPEAHRVLTSLGSASVCPTAQLLRQLVPVGAMPCLPIQLQLMLLVEGILK